MWRWALILVFALGAHLHARAAVCLETPPLAMVQYYGASGNVHQFSADYTQPYVPAVSANFAGTYTSGKTIVVGSLCNSGGGSSVGIYLSNDEYQVLIDAATVNTSVLAFQASFSAFVEEFRMFAPMLLLVIGLLAGFMFGWRIVQRRDSQ